MDCRKQGCSYYDIRMEDNCTKGDPPDVENCPIRISSKLGTESLRGELNRLNAEITRLQSSLTLSREEGRREGMMRAAEIAGQKFSKPAYEVAAAIRSEAKGATHQG